MTSRIPGFYRLPPEKRLDALEAHRNVQGSKLDAYRQDGLTVAQADLMVENVISTFAMPNAVAVNFLINGRDRIVPMVVEEPSVVAAVSNMAKLTRTDGGFTAQADPSVMIGQIQLTELGDPDTVVRQLEEQIPEFMQVAASVHPRLAERGGGPRGFEVRRITYDEPGHEPEEMVVLHVLLDCADAMGANMVNTVCERLAPLVEQATHARVGLRILSNLADRRLARAHVRLSPVSLATDQQDGQQVARAIASAWRFAWADPYRAATHNKGIMNGVDAVCIATGNDWRAVEAGAHAYAARDGQYRPLTRWEVDESGFLVGSIEIPLQMGTVGGPIRVHPTVQSNLHLLDEPNARDLAMVTATVGLAQNLGALKALATDGIQRGHMRMHARTIAATAGANAEEARQVVLHLCSSGEFSVEAAKRCLSQIRQADSD